MKECLIYVLSKISVVLLTGDLYFEVSKLPEVPEGILTKDEKRDTKIRR